MAARVPAEASFSSSSLALGWESSLFAMIEVFPRRWDLNPWATWDVWPLPLSPAEVVGDLEVPVMPPIAFIQAELGTWSSRYGGFEVLLLILSLVRGELRTSSYGPRRMPTPVLSPRAGGNMFPPSSVHGVKHEVTSTLGPSEDHTMDFRFLYGCFQLCFLGSLERLPLSAQHFSTYWMETLVLFSRERY